MKKKTPKIFESVVIEHVELESDKMDSNQIDELLKRLNDVTLNGTDSRCVIYSLTLIFIFVSSKLKLTSLLLNLFSSDDLRSLPLPEGEFTLPSLPATFLDVTIDQNQVSLNG